MSVLTLALPIQLLRGHHPHYFHRRHPHDEKDLHHGHRLMIMTQTKKDLRLV